MICDTCIRKETKPNSTGNEEDNTKKDKKKNKKKRKQNSSSMPAESNENDWWDGEKPNWLTNDINTSTAWNQGICPNWTQVPERLDPAWGNICNGDVNACVTKCVRGNCSSGDQKPNNDNPSRGNYGEANTNHYSGPSWDNPQLCSGHHNCQTGDRSWARNETNTQPDPRIGLNSWGTFQGDNQINGKPGGIYTCCNKENSPVNSNTDGNWKNGQREIQNPQKERLHHSNWNDNSGYIYAAQCPNSNGELFRKNQPRSHPTGLSDRNGARVGTRGHAQVGGPNGCSNSQIAPNIYNNGCLVNETRREGECSAKHNNQNHQQCSKKYPSYSNGNDGSSHVCCGHSKSTQCIHRGDVKGSWVWVPGHNTATSKSWTGCQNKTQYSPAQGVQECRTCRTDQANESGNNSSSKDINFRMENGKGVFNQADPTFSGPCYSQICATGHDTPYCYCQQGNRNRCCCGLALSPQSQQHRLNTVQLHEDSHAKAVSCGALCDIESSLNKLNFNTKASHSSSRPQACCNLINCFLHCPIASNCPHATGMDAICMYCRNLSCVGMRSEIPCRQMGLIDQAALNSEPSNQNNPFCASHGSRSRTVNAAPEKITLGGSQHQFVAREDVVGCPSNPPANAHFNTVTGKLTIYHGACQIGDCDVCGNAIPARFGGEGMLHPGQNLSNGGINGGCESGVRSNRRGRDRGDGW
jgi:hypothetical protein